MLPASAADTAAGNHHWTFTRIEFAGGSQLAALETLIDERQQTTHQVWIVDFQTGHLKWRSEFSSEWQYNLVGWDAAGKTLYVRRSRPLPGDSTPAGHYAREVYRVQANPDGTWAAAPLPGLSPTQTDVMAYAPLVLGKTALVLRWHEHPGDPGTFLLYDTVAGATKPLPELDGYNVRVAGRGRYVLASKTSPLPPTGPNQTPGTTQTEMQLMALASGESSPLEIPPGCSWLPSISPDGRWAVWALDQPGATTHLVVCSLRGEAPRNLEVRGSGFHQELWSDDGRYLMYCTQFGYWKIEPAANSAVRLDTPHSWLTDGPDVTWVPGTHELVAWPFDQPGTMGDADAEQHGVWRLDADHPGAKWTEIWKIPAGPVAVEPPHN
jgi:hypothetical protein